MCVQARTHTHMQHRTQRLLSMSCRKSNHHHSNLIWVQSVLTAISFTKTARSTFSHVQCFSAVQHLTAEGQSEVGLLQLKSRRCVLLLAIRLMTVLMVTCIALEGHDKCTQVTLSIGKKDNKCVSASVSLGLVSHLHMI